MFLVFAICQASTKIFEVDNMKFYPTYVYIQKIQLIPISLNIIALYIVKFYNQEMQTIQNIIRCV